MSAPGTPKASQAAITAVQEALGCRREQFVLQPGEPWGCGTHAGYRDFEWTERGCPVAVAAADAAAPHNAAQAIEALALSTERCCDRYDADRADGDYSVYTCSDTDMECMTRLVTPWSRR